MVHRKRDVAAIALTAFILVCLAGQAMVYVDNPYRCDVSVERSGEAAVVTIDTNYSLGYTAASLVTESMREVESYAVWYDEAYPVQGDRDAILAGIDHLRLSFENNHSELSAIDTAGLAGIMGSRDTSVAVVFITGTLPDTVYTGSDDDPIFGWLEAGGAMYWINGKIGRTSASADGALTAVHDADVLFFGSDGVVNPSAADTYTRNISEGSLTDVMGIYYGETTNGVDCSRLTSDHLTLDCDDGRYSAVAFVRYHGGTGTIGVFGGHLKYEAVPTSVMASVSQAVISRLSYDTVLIDHAEGSGSAEVELECGGDGAYVFVYFGEMNTVWGACIPVPADGAVVRT